MSDNEKNKTVLENIIELNKLDINSLNNEEFIEKAIKLLSESGVTFPEIKKYLLYA